MKTLNPNFPVPDEIKAELDSWYGEGKYTPLICWNDYNDSSIFFVVVKIERCEDEGYSDQIHMVRLFKVYDFTADLPIETYVWALSVDAQE
jgi:hypothetical protein